MGDLKSTQIIYGENVLMMRVDDCLIFGNKDGVRRLAEKLEERTAKVDRDAIFPVTVCGVCHSIVAYPNNYCSNCGAKLDWSE